MSEIRANDRNEDTDFQRMAERVTDWIVDYFRHPELHPVLSRVKPGDVKSSLPPDPPETGRSYEEIFSDFERHILPGITHWNHPSFHAYFSITGSYPGIIGEYLSSALNVNGMLWSTSPAATELEELSLAYLRKMLGLDDDLFGVILDTASTSTLVAMSAARESLGGLDIRTKGMAGRNDLPRLTAYISEEAHSSVEKAAIVLGIGQDNVRKIRTDREFRMDPEELLLRIEEDLALGMRPMCVIATVGTTSTTSVDPVPEISKICRRFDIWLHVDAAYAGIAAIIPEKRDTLRGCEHVDSLVVNPHKWLGTPIDLSALYIRKPQILKRALSLVPEYLRDLDEDPVVNLMDYGFQLGRRFRALKLWMVINYYGIRGLQSKIRGHISMAQELRNWLEKNPFFEVMAPAPFSTVCFRLSPRGRTGTALSESDLDEINERFLRAVNDTGKVFLSHTRIKGKFAIRCAIGNMRTSEAHIALLKTILDEKAGETAAT